MERESDVTFGHTPPVLGGAFTDQVEIWARGDVNLVACQQATMDKASLRTSTE